jgi:hypothetical protein
MATQPLPPEAESWKVIEQIRKLVNDKNVPDSNGKLIQIAGLCHSYLLARATHCSHLLIS